MTQNQVLRWLEGNGWLVLSGGTDKLSDIRAQALARLQLDGHVVYLGLSDEDEDELLDDMGELGAPTGFLLNVVMEDDDTIRSMLRDAAMIFIPGDVDAYALRSALAGAAVDGMKAAYERGAIILGEGSGAMLLGAVAADRAEPFDGIGWLRDTFVAPAVSSVAESDVARELLAMQKVGVAVGIAVGSALVLGPDGQVETWGAREVTIALSGASTE